MKSELLFPTGIKPLRRKPTFKKNSYEFYAWERSELVCGIDEVGRSCFAGPVVAAAAILHPYAKHPLLKDSKLLTPEERLKVYKWLLKHSTFAVGIMHHRHIDSLNIYHATLSAMKRAVNQLCIQQKPHLILVDAMPVQVSPHIPVVYFPYGEKKSSSIAAASIIAKVTRDNLMDRMHQALPCFGFSHNKGYGTKIHRDALEVFGITPIHRHSFLKSQQDTCSNSSLFSESESIEEIIE